MSKIGRNFTLRLILSFTICASLLWVPGVSLLSEASHGQGQSAGRDGRPRPRKPEGTLPDLEEVKKESKVEREAPPPIPSTMRSPKLSEKPWDGRRVGDPETTSRRLDQAVVIDKKIRRAHAQARRTPHQRLNNNRVIQFSLTRTRIAPSREMLKTATLQVRI